MPGLRDGQHHGRRWHYHRRPVKVGKGGKYAKLDALVMDAVNELIDPIFRMTPNWS